ncbi:substrate-binding domain-containing protein [Yoonia sp. BS5-3]|uniref:PstS family phosphate ABC transporter substrate-binding protein n=1 Tax=Yoonia phaeophyticola TaxID=3137369 RepID=A0ABZ2VAC6_9RHOB
MLRNVIPFLLCTAAPTALLAQQVELRSSDAFISVAGEIVGFNGVMVSVDTLVGQVSVPASEVICYGEGCSAILASNNFGLTADDFEDVVIAEAVILEDLSDDYVISFASPSFNTLYRTIAGAFAVSNETTSTVALTAAGQMSLQNDTGNETATVALATGNAASDLRVATQSLRGAQSAAFTASGGWATTSTPPYQLLGLDAFAVIIAADVAVDMITMDQLAGIYAGEITNWSQIGGADQNILPLQLPVDSPLRSELITLVMEPAGKSISNSILTMGDETSIAGSVGQFPGSISVVSLENADGSNIAAVSGACGVPVTPNAFNIVSGDYPLVRPIMATYDRAPNTSLVTELFDFATSDTAQELIAREGFVDGTAFAQDGDAKSARLGSLLNAALNEDARATAAEMFELLFASERLSPSMVGGPTSGPEAAWNRAMMLDLIDLVADGGFAGRNIYFVGLGDGAAGGEAARLASQRAAAEIEAAFREIAGDVIGDNDLTLSSYGFGGLAPATCYESQTSGPTPTRVEVWAR